MSRRRVSVKELGKVDCQGWLLRRKEGRSFLGSKWKKYWFVLKKSSLYWYSDKMAEKAEGFINLSGFTIERAKQCRKKHAITATHSLIVTIFMAAETFTEMNKWISKLSEAAESCDDVNAEDCYSEDSDEDGDESSSCCLDPEQEVEPDPENGDAPRPLCESPSAASPPSAGNRRWSTSEAAALTRDRRRRSASDGSERLSCPDLPGHSAGASLPLIHVREDELVLDKPADEMESLYQGLKAASLSPMGRSSRRDFRSSFIRRCQDDKVNDKVHLLRILSSTLKAKEAELQALDQILTHPDLTAATYRKWRLSNSIFLQEIHQRKQAAGGAAALRPPDAAV